LQPAADSPSSIGVLRFHCASCCVAPSPVGRLEEKAPQAGRTVTEAKAAIVATHRRLAELKKRLQ
jgi:hypothetical protein